jgi:hypothetical protein
VDISKWQDPTQIDWGVLKKMCQFVLCRATRGCDRDDRLEHDVELIRSQGLGLGVYHSFQPGVSVQLQFSAYTVARETVGYEEGDLVPCLKLADDLEAPEDLRRVSPAWSVPARRLCTLLVEAYGEAMPYVSPAVYLALGSPAWMNPRPIAVAGSKPLSGFRSSASGEWSVWQRDQALGAPSSPPAVDPALTERIVRVPHRAPRVLRAGGWDRELFTPDPNARRGVTVA